MVSPRHLQVSFSGGELSPEMWSRHDDTRFRSGAARVRNMITHPRGSVARRPGFEHVRQAKEDATAVRLIPFRYSRDQTFVIEMGVAPRAGGGDDLGYFRFHTNGSTLLHLRPDAHLAPSAVAGINTGTDQWDLSSHTLSTGDPVVVTAWNKTNVVTFTSGTVTVNEVAHGYLVGEAVFFDTTTGLPFVNRVVGPDTRLQTHRAYYVVAFTVNAFQVAETRGGPALTFTTAGTGPHWASAIPSPNFDTVLFPFDANTTYYVIRVDAKYIELAPTRQDALDNNGFDWVSTGTSGLASSLRVHYDYRVGDRVTESANAYYCSKIPWGLPSSIFCQERDHLEAGHGPTDPSNYWALMPGKLSTVTFDTGTDEVVWAGHGFADGDPVTFSVNATGVLPSPLVVGTAYYVRGGTGGRFKLSTNPLILDTIDIGAGFIATTTGFGNCIFEVPHYYDATILFEVNHAQSNDILTLTHPTWPVTELSRRGPTHWVWDKVAFAPTLSPPIIAVTAFRGEGHKPLSVTAGTPALLTFTADHSFAAGDRVQVVDVGDITSGHYVVETAPSLTTLTLKNFEDGAETTSGTPTIVATSRVRSSAYSETWNATYAVTAVDADGKESAVSNTYSIENNLLAAGANNTLTWGTVIGAAKYRVYKDENGLLGFLGEVETPKTTFVDENIGPDFSEAPPTHDDSLRRTSVITANITDDTIQWGDHGLELGAPVVFETDGTLPDGLTPFVTYYVVGALSENAFQVGTVIDGVPIDLIDIGTGIHYVEAGFWPGAVCYFEQRRVFGGALLRPQDFWLTVSSTESTLTYRLPVRDEDRIYNRLAARQRSEIRHAVPVGHLLLLTDAAEFRLTPLNSDALTPTSVAARAPTQIGVANVAPVVVNNTVLFPSARGGHIRELGFLDSVSDYVTGDVSLRAAHLFENRTIVQMAYHQAPHPVVWAVSSSGTLLGFSYMPEEQLAGWHEHDIDGTFESCAVVAEGDEDRLYVVTLREGVRYIERMGCQCFPTRNDAFFVDFGTTYDGTAVTSIFVPHLASKAVSYLADGVIGTATVSAAGVLTLATAASKIHVGLAYTNQLRTLPLGLQIDSALGSGRARNVSQVWLRLSESGAFLAGESSPALHRSPDPAAGALLTSLEPVVILGAWNLDGQIYVEQSEPLPLNIAGMTIAVAIGG